MKETTVKIEVLNDHFRRYFPSLKNYPEKYLHLFNYAADTQPYHFAYLCPLCLRNGIMISNENGLSMHCEFSPDHYPPKSVGGSDSLLVCTHCNSQAGKDYDFSLKQKIKDIAFLKRVPSATIVSKHLKVERSSSDVVGSYPALFKIAKDGEMELSVKPFKIHAPYLDEFIEYSKIKRDYKLIVNIQMADEIKVARAVIKAAYLQCFEFWGYEFAFSYSAGMIREVISGECQYPVDAPTFYMGDALKSNDGLKIPKGICYLNNPEELKAFAVTMCLTDKDSDFSEIIGVMIPGPDKEHWEKFARIKEFIIKSSELNVELMQVREFYIPDCKSGYSKCWSLLNQN